MSDSTKITKPKYEAPNIVTLGELARGAGYCAAGNGATPDNGNYCTAGVTNYVACTEGNAALNACTAGVSALAACTAGGHV